jgi:hypothetical protein
VNPKPQAKVLRLLRFDAGRWRYWQTLRAQGQTAKAIELERASIRASVRHIRENIGRQAITHRADCIEFTDPPTSGRPFSLKPESVQGRTVIVSGCHPGGFAAWVYCYAHRIGWKPQAKATDLL